jgi:protein-disulfide isomerase
MSAGTGADRIAGDAASAQASGVTLAPSFFLNGAPCRFELR